MTYDEIAAKINARAYEPKMAFPKPQYARNHIFDEEKSVRWNREQEELHAEEYKKQLDAYRESANAGSRQFKEDVLLMLEENYGLNKKQLDIVYAAAYDDGHSAGFREVLYYANQYADCARDIIWAQEKGD